jgi:hypothetical protein
VPNHSIEALEMLLPLRLACLPQLRLTQAPQLRKEIKDLFSFRMLLIIYLMSRHFKKSVLQ